VAKFDLILRNNPVVSEIVENILTNKSKAKRDLLRAILDGIDIKDAKKILEQFLANEKEFKVE
jgi:hypothetical protein